MQANYQPVKTRQELFSRISRKDPLGLHKNENPLDVSNSKFELQINNHEKQTKAFVES